MNSKQKILVVDDNLALLRSLNDHLKNDYSVTCAKSGKSAIQLLANNIYACIILDLYLIDCSGLKIVDNLRNKLCDTPILIISGDDTVINKVSLLDAGANDYVTKPFVIEELKARLRVLIRKNLSSKSYRIVCEDLIIDTKSKQVSRDGVSVLLRGKEYGILECLAYNAGNVMPRTALMNYAWEVGSDPWPSTINVHIKSLRDKIDRPFERQLITTVRDEGYRLDAAAQIIPV